jgi:hypothetical protein
MVSCVTVHNRFYERPEAPPTRLRRRPRLASWNAAGHPDQVRLRAALEDAGELLAPSLAKLDVPLALRLDVGLPSAVPLLGEHDLDNYAYPLAFYLAKQTTRQFVSVWCTKQHADKSFVRAEPAVVITDRASYDYAIEVHTTASASTSAYKQQILDQLDGATEVAVGPVSLQIGFIVGPRRNWLNLWKPTIDALDQLLGRTRPDRPWHPRDGRITELGLHRTLDDDLGNDVLMAISVSSGHQEDRSNGVTGRD